MRELRSLCSLRPLPPFPASPANAELVSGGPFPYSFEGTRYQKQASTVRNMRAVSKKASSGTRRIFRSIRCKKQAFPVQKGYSVHENPLLGYATRFLRHSVQKTGFYGTKGKFGVKSRLLVYRIDARYRRRTPGVRGEFIIQKRAAPESPSPTHKSTLTPQKRPDPILTPIKAKRPTDSRRPTLRLCTKT